MYPMDYAPIILFVFLNTLLLLCYTGALEILWVATAPINATKLN